MVFLTSASLVSLGNIFSVPTSDLLYLNLHFIKILVDSYANSNLRRIALLYYELLHINTQVLFSCECLNMPSKVPNPGVEEKEEEVGKKITAMLCQDLLSA